MALLTDFKGTKPRTPKPFLHEGWYTTDAGGPPRTKLCREEDGYKHAELCLARWRIRVLEVKQSSVLPAGGRTSIAGLLKMA